MSTRVYWKYFAEDPTVFSKEIVPISGLTEVNNIALSDGMSRFDIEWYNTIEKNILAALTARCWRFPDVTATYVAEEFTDSSLIVRQWMLRLPLPKRIKQATDDFVKKCDEDKWKIINGLSGENKTICSDKDFITHISWAIYKQKILRPFGAKLYIVENNLPPEFLGLLNRRVAESFKVRLTSGTDGLMKTIGRYKEYTVDTFHITCTCDDFIHQSLKNGMHCKHLIAGLREKGIWDLLWGDFMKEIIHWSNEDYFLNPYLDYF